MSSARNQARATDREVAELLEVASEWGCEAGQFTLRHFGHRVDFDDKPDGTPVTAADRGAEELLRERIVTRFPDHGVLGEEHGETNRGARVRWVIDPIDGTRAFARGVPIFGVLIGIEIEGEAVVGVAYFPALGELVAAGRRLGCFWNGRPSRVSDTERIEDSLLLTTDVRQILARTEGAGYRRLQQRALFTRTWGDCYGHCLVATGRAEVMVDPVMAAWDAGPFPVILTEAGGRFTSLAGEATMHGESGVSTNGRLHDEVLRTLAVA